VSILIHCDFGPCNQARTEAPIRVYGKDTSWYVVSRESDRDYHFCSALHLTAYFVIDRDVDYNVLADIIVSANANH